MLDYFFFLRTQVHVRDLPQSILSPLSKSSIIPRYIKCYPDTNTQKITAERTYLTDSKVNDLLVVNLMELTLCLCNCKFIICKV
jgi:hypothetical protein